MNTVIILGRITREPETKQAGETTVTKFTVAVDRKFKKDETDFISCVAFGKAADFISKYFHKGMKIALDGRIQTGSYTNKDGKTVYTTDVVVEEVEFAESKKVEEPREESNEWMNVPDGIEADLPFR